MARPARPLERKRQTRPDCTMANSQSSLAGKVVVAAVVLIGLAAAYYASTQLSEPQTQPPTNARDGSTTNPDRADPVSQATEEAAASATEQTTLAEFATSVAAAVDQADTRADPGAVADAAVLAARSALPGVDPDEVRETVTAAMVEQQAASYVASLTEPDATPVSVEAADHFVTKEQVISLLPEALVELTTQADMLNDPTLDPDTPITVVREVEQLEVATAEKLIAAAGGDLDTAVRVVIDEQEVELKVRDVLQKLGDAPEEPISMIRSVQYYEVTTPAEYAANHALELDQPLHIIKQPYQLEAATVAELLKQHLDLADDTIFYVRTVRGNDGQGIWGIVHDGLVDNFARGMAIRKGEEIASYQVEIPEHADEILDDRSSSFLGKLIYEKTLETYVYNFKHARIGRNPNQIFPGQEIVIVNFEPKELIDIYKHFLEESG